MAGNTTSLRRALVDLLRTEGSLTSLAVAEAFLSVPRERFLPEVAQRDGLEAVYRNDAIVTRRDERGMPVSSSSQPSIMAAMLEALAVEPGHRVLEVGTGTGYNAALLATLVGTTGRVTSVELDPELAARAAAALRQGGEQVDVVVGDGHDGWPPGAPYDRMIVTASGPDVPRAWFDQLGDGALVVMPLWLRGPLQSVVAFRRQAEGLESRAIIPGGFMGLRRNLDHIPPVLHHQLSASDHVDSSTRRPLVSLSGAALRHLDPPARRRLLALALGPPREPPLPVPAPQAELRLFVTLAAPDECLVECYDGSTGESVPGLVGGDGASLAVLGRAPVVEHLDAWGGPEAEEALAGLLARWEDLGRPALERLRVRVGYEPAAQGSRRRDATIAFDWV